MFLTTRFFAIGAVIVALFGFSLAWDALFPIAQTALVVWLSLTVIEVVLLFRPGARMSALRKLPQLMSLGDENEIQLKVVNRIGLPVKVRIIDELPNQFQMRDFGFNVRFGIGEKKDIFYPLRPTSRGVYRFGRIRMFTSTPIRMVQRRFTSGEESSVKVYPSIIQMRKYALHQLPKLQQHQGIKQIRRIGHSYEFERIKNYVQGDDYRSVNWKATGRRNQLMVNMYEDERSQPVYCIIDKSRSMKLQFNGLSLMDYAVNTSLIISNVALGKADRAGLITFHSEISTLLKAQNKATQLRRILDTLYNEREGGLEANYELLYTVIKNVISGRSLLFLFTNFESMYALERVLPLLRRLNRQHLLVVVFFENSEILDFSQGEPGTLEGIYEQTIARKFMYEKYQMGQLLRQYGIQTILTRPDDLTINSINKYLELKARGLI